MKLDGITPAILGIALSALLAASASIFVYRSWPPEENPGVQAPVVAWSIPELPKIEMGRSRTSNDYPEITTRPVFSKTRQPFQAPNPVSQPKPGFVPSPVAQRPNVTLLAIYVSQDVKKAFLVGPSEPEGRWIDNGQQLSGWTLSEIEPDRISLKSGDNSFVLRLTPAQDE